MISAKFLGNATVHPSINLVAITHADCMAWRWKARDLGVAHACRTSG